MPVPPKTSALLYAGGSFTLPGADTQDCAGARFHTPRPMFVRPVRLVPTDWLTERHLNPGVIPDTVWLCGVCRDNLAILQQILRARGGDVAWEVRREFGNELRALALRGWELYATLTGRR